MLNKHFFKMLIIFLIIIGLGILSVFLVDGGDYAFSFFDFEEIRETLQAWYEGLTS